MKKTGRFVFVAAAAVIAPVFAGNDSAQSFRMAQKAFDSAQYRDAIKYLNDCQRDSLFYKLRGISFHRLKIADSAAIYLREAFLLGEKDDNTLITLSETLIWLGDTKDADAILEMVKNKNGIAYLKVLAEKLTQEKQFRDAVKVYDAILSISPDAGDVTEERAKTLAWNKDFREAEKSYSAVIGNHKYPQSLQQRCLVSRAQVYSWEKDFDRAGKDIAAALGTDPKDISALLLKAQICSWKGDYKAAKKIYSSILQIDPANKDALYYIEKLSWAE